MYKSILLLTKHIRIKSTVRKLLKSVKFSNIVPRIDCFIAPVIYENLENLNILNVLMENNRDYLDYYTPLFLKRKTYSYEKELRFVIFALDKDADYYNSIEEGPKEFSYSKPNYIYLKLKDANFIDEIELDPRLSRDEMNSQKNILSITDVNVVWHSLYEVPKTVKIKASDVEPLKELPENCKLWDGENDLTLKFIKEYHNKYVSENE